MLDLSTLGSSFIDFLCGALPHYRAFAIYSYFQTVVLVLWLTFRSLVDTTPVRGFCCRLLWAAPGIALLSSPGWASLWRLFALFYAVFASPSQDKLSGIWGGCSFTFHTFHLRDWNCLRVFLALLLWRKLGFPMKTSFNGHQPLQLVQTLSFPVSHAHFWLRHRCFLRVSPKPSSLVASSHSGIGAFLWISPEPSSLCPLETLLSLPCVWTLLVPVAFCMFLYTLDV